MASKATQSGSVHVAMAVDNTHEPQRTDHRPQSHLTQLGEPQLAAPAAIQAPPPRPANAVPESRLPWGGAGHLVSLFWDGVELPTVSKALADHLGSLPLGLSAYEAGFSARINRVSDPSRPGNKGLVVKYPKLLVEHFLTSTAEHSAHALMSQLELNRVWRVRARVDGNDLRVSSTQPQFVHEVMCTGVAVGRKDLETVGAEIKAALLLDDLMAEVFVCAHPQHKWTTGRVFIRLENRSACESLCDRLPLRVAVLQGVSPCHATRLARGETRSRQLRKLPPFSAIAAPAARAPLAQGGQRLPARPVPAAPAPRQPAWSRSADPRPQDSAAAAAATVPAASPPGPTPQEASLRHAVDTLTAMVDRLRSDLARERSEREQQRKEFARQLEQQREEHLRELAELQTSGALEPQPHAATDWTRVLSRKSKKSTPEVSSEPLAVSPVAPAPALHVHSPASPPSPSTVTAVPARPGTSPPPTPSLRPHPASLSSKTPSQRLPSRHQLAAYSPTNPSSSSAESSPTQSDPKKARPGGGTPVLNQ